MSSLKLLKTAALSSVCLLPLMAAAHADDSAAANTSQELSVGIQDTFGSARDWGTYEKYNGNEQGAAGILGWDVRSHDAWNSGKTFYYNITGDNFLYSVANVAPEADANMSVGEQGKWGLSADYWAMTYTGDENFLSGLTKDGALAPNFSSALTTTATNAAAAYPAGFGAVAGDFFGALNARSHVATENARYAAQGTYSEVVGSQIGEMVTPIGTRRDRVGINGKYDISDWELSSGVTYEHKIGSIEDAMTTAGSNAGPLAFALPIDYSTTNFRATAAYNTHDMQGKLEYEYSMFTDNNSSFGFQGWMYQAVPNGATTSVTRPGGAVANGSAGLSSNGNGTVSPVALSGYFAQAPNNQAHTFTGEIGFSPTPTTRVVGTAVYGLQYQNDSLAPATANAAVVNNATFAGLLAENPSSLNGMVQTFFGSALVTANPVDKLNLKGRYSVDVRDPLYGSKWIWGDPTDTTGLSQREAVPLSWTKNTLALSGDYRVLPSTKAELDYTLRDNERGNAITHHTLENEEGVKLHSSITPELNGTVGYSHSNVSASAPDFSMWNSQIAAGDCGGAVTTCQEIPFYEAARTTDAGTANLMGMITRELSTGVMFKVANTRYDDPSLQAGWIGDGVGLQNDLTMQFGPSLTYSLTRDTGATVFFSHVVDNRQLRNLMGGSAAPNPVYDIESTTYIIDSAGIDLKWAVNDRLKVGADYAISHGNQSFAQMSSNPAAAGANLGDPYLSNSTIDNQVRAHAVYELAPGLQVGLMYSFDTIDLTDYALAGPTIGQMVTGDLAPHYNVSTLMAQTRVRF